MSQSEGGGIQPFQGEPWWGDDSEWLIAEGHVPDEVFAPWVLAKIRTQWGESDVADALELTDGRVVGERIYATPSTEPWQGFDPGEWWAWHRVAGPGAVPITVWSMDGTVVAAHDHPQPPPPERPEPPLEPWTAPPRPEDHEGVTRVVLP